MLIRSSIIRRAVGSVLSGSWPILSAGRGIEQSWLARREKYTQHKGVKGIRNRKVSDFETKSWENEDEEHNELDQALKMDDREYDDLVHNAMHVTRDVGALKQNVLIIQPYIKWTPSQQRSQVRVQPDDQLYEAEALVRSLPNWHVVHSLKVPLESLDRRQLFGTGKLEELKSLMQQLRSKGSSVSCMFVSKGSLSFAQKRQLEMEFKLPVMDRYSIVIQILRLHATSAEARLQVAMAEIPYIWAQAKDANLSMSRKQGWSLTDTQREILKTREKKLKQELERIRTHRKLLRQKRQQKKYPVVAVVGYTNAGKTSLIKALTQEQNMQPRDQLFATLDVTAHAGVLPCKLEVIYMDTVGFMSDLPTGLIECFVATLEDAMLADVIIHVQDVSHACHVSQRDHVTSTLHSLASNITNSLAHEDAGTVQLPPIINVGNKVDLVKDGLQTPDDDLLLVSAKQQTGLHDLLLAVENKVLNATGRRKLTMRVSNGGPEVAWLYKNATVMYMKADPKDAQLLLMNVLITERSLEQFKREFCQ